MEKPRASMGVGSYANVPRQRAEQAGQPRNRAAAQSSMPRGSSLAVGAKTLAGIGIGLITVVGGAALLGVAAETVLIPSLLVKLAGGIAGGGVGMAKGLKDAQNAG